MEKLKGENMKMEEDIGLSDRHLMYIGVFGLIFLISVIILDKEQGSFG